MTEPKLLRAYGDREGDGMVQLSFTLAVDPGDRAREAAKRFAEAHGLKDPLVTAMEQAARG
jgi:beta-lysine 5,6-aminomutase beta subunit